MIQISTHHILCKWNGKTALLPRIKAMSFGLWCDQGSDCTVPASKEHQDQIPYSGTPLAMPRRLVTGCRDHSMKI
jgi:hypothetical protein